MKSKKATAPNKTRKSQKKNLLIASDSYLPRWDGIARFLSEIIPELHDEFNITVIAPKYSGKYFISNKIKEIRMPIADFQIGDYTPSKFDKKQIIPHIKNADIIWTQTIGPIGKNVINIGKNLNKKIIADIHSIEWELVSRSINQPLLREPISRLVINYARSTYNRCDLLMVPSKTTGDVLSWKKINTKKAIVPLGINTNKFIPAENKDNAKMNINISPKIRIIGFVGRIAHEKNLATLARAFLRVKEEYENIMLIIVGEGIDELKKKFSRINGVKLIGPQNNVVPYLQAMDIYVLPSYTETTSLSTLEAMACEIPVIVTPVGEMNNYIINEVNGFKFEKENSYDLCVKIRRLLDSPELRSRIGKTGRETVIGRFNWNTTIKNIKDILREF
jgi:glycosyltransferase involved in cell wall biosynthesis